MAYDASYYPPQQQRPYNGPAAPKPRPPPGAQQPRPTQQYPPQGSDYEQDQYPQDYGYGGHDNGYAQDYNGGGGYGMSGGARGNGYPPQGQNYPPQKGNYGGGSRGGGMPPQSRGRGGGPMPRPPPGDGGRGGGYDQRAPGRGYPNSGPPMGRGGRPAPTDRGRTSDPGSRQVRRPLKTPPMSPGQASWDNPFPVFPDARKKPNSPEEQMARGMANMDLGQSQNRPRTAGGNAGQDRYGSGRQGYPGQRRGPPMPAPGPGHGPPRQNGYADPGYEGGAYGPVSPLRDDFAPPPRSMTLPNDPRMPAPRHPPVMNGLPPNERPYNGPVGRGIPPRPSTATGARPPPLQTYPEAHADNYANQDLAHRSIESISDLYDSYFDTPQNHVRSQSNSSEMPNFEALQENSGDLKRQQSIEEHIKPGGQQNGYHGQAKPVQSQPDHRGQAQPQAAIFEMAGENPTIPNQPQQGYGQGYPDERYGPQGGFEVPQSGYGSYNGPPGQSNKPLSPDALPSHPAPVRPGLIPNSVPNQASSRPAPVRNYNNSSPGNPQQVSQPPGPAPDEPPPVTNAELDQLRTSMRNNPSDLDTQLLLARKLVEASEILVPKIADQRARNKAREKYVLDAHKMLKKLVAAGNAEAMFYLADCYGRGSLGLETNDKEAFFLYQSAAKAGHAQAAYRTAVCCEIGNEDGGGTRKDPMKAIQWYRRAATLGDPPAMYKMGMILLKGLLGQPKNPREAVGWLKRAADLADAENPHALHELGLLYEQPQGQEGSIVRDEAYSLSLFQKAADLGYKFSQFRLGCAFEYGLFNLPIDPRQSIMWYSRAAVQEEHQSELALSGWYLTGSEGVLQQSDTEAYLWARKAAMAGLAKAEYAMGYFTEVGIGIPGNLEDAKRWYWRAAAQNFPKARDRLEDLKKGGTKSAVTRERISRSKVGKQNEGECVVM